MGSVQAELAHCRAENVQLLEENNQLRAACGMQPVRIGRCTATICIAWQYSVDCCFAIFSLPPPLQRDVSAAPAEVDEMPSRPSKRARGAAGKHGSVTKLDHAGSNGTDVAVLHAPSAKHSSDTSCKTETDKPAATTAATVKA